MIINFLMSVLFGMIPEVLFFTLFLIYTKNLTEKKIRLFLLIAMIYIICIMIQKYKTLYYVIFIFLIYIILKVLYKSKIQITDFFAISISTGYLTVLALLIYLPHNLFQYLICLAINRILLFLPFIFKDKFSLIYKKYYSLWNRNYEKKQPIKSITIRNISLISINLLILFFNILSIYMINITK